MKYIISKTEEPIKFNLTSSRSVVIDTVVPIQVTDEEFIVLEGRLGAQIESVIVPGFSTEVISKEEAKQAEEVVVPREEVVDDLGEEEVAKIEAEAETVEVSPEDSKEDEPLLEEGEEDEEE